MSNSSVVRGGILSLPRAQYSPETCKLLKLLMDEAKLTNLQRKNVNNSLRTGEPLPILQSKPRRTSYVDDNLFGSKKNYYFQKRTKNQILDSGAYERDDYIPKQLPVDHEREKMQLQCIMETGKRLKKPAPLVKQPCKKDKYGKITPEERYEQLVSEITDRLQFLEDMISLGEGKKYELQIKQEIAAKLREMDSLKTGAKPFANIVSDYKINNFLSWEN